MRRSGEEGGSFLSEEPTQVGPDLAAPPLERAVGSAAVRRYEAALLGLPPRDREALRGRIERQQSYAALARTLGVTTARAARAAVTRALGRLVEGDERARPGLAHLAGLVGSVADGWPQDWDALHARAEDSRTRRALGSLRLVAAIADFHRGTAPSVRVRGGEEDRSSKAGGGETPAGRVTPAPRVRPALGQWGRFLLLRRLGEGAYGEVYQAHDTQLDRDVALKLLKPSRSSDEPTGRLLAEARMLARVRHPNVASVYGTGEQDGRCGMWMELVRGVNLEELLHSRGPLSACEAALVGLDLCRALAAVHGAGLVHRDVKASNVMREVGGRIVLTDFGAGRDRALEPRRQFAGTPLYVAPEVLGGSDATVLSDLYSLGVVLFRLVTESYPRRAERLEDLLDARAASALTSLRDFRPDLPDAFVAAVEQALACDPADRPQSAGAFRAALGLVLGVPPSWRKAHSCSAQDMALSRGAEPPPPEPTAEWRPPA